MEKKLPGTKEEKVSHYTLKCPYCKKKLGSVYIKQLNQNYKSHVDNCLENPMNNNLNKIGGKNG